MDAQYDSYKEAGDSNGCVVELEDELHFLEKDTFLKDLQNLEQPRHPHESVKPWQASYSDETLARHVDIPSLLGFPIKDKVEYEIDWYASKDVDEEPRLEVLHRYALSRVVNNLLLWRKDA